MRWIKDSIHGDIFISPIADALLDTPALQRLRRVAQTSFSNMIYPGANHTRFEHSIGTYYLTSRASFFNNLEKAEGTRLIMAALLHDVGHSAFSHALEGVVEKHTGKDHQAHTVDKITTGELAEALEANGVSPSDVASVYGQPVGKAILGYLGTDKMDYLLRDAHYTGVAYGTVDADRILRKVLVRRDGIALEEKGVSAAEAMLMARFLMYSNVYFHPVAIAADMMIARAADDSIASGATKAPELTELDDWQLMTRLLGEPGLAGDFAKRLYNREIYKVGCQRRMRDFKNWLHLGELTDADIAEAEAEIAGKAGLAPEQVMLYVPATWFRDVGIQVLKDGDYYSLDELSLITRLLKEAQWDYLDVRVFCPAECREKIAATGLSCLEAYGGD